MNRTRTYSDLKVCLSTSIIKENHNGSIIKET